MPNSSDKVQSLRTGKCLNPHPERVRDMLFREHPFFDARDLMQVKYEMLRSVRDDGITVVESSERFGLSRQTYYAAADAFAAEGLMGLLPKRSGPRKAHKFSPELVAELNAAWHRHPRPSLSELVTLVESRIGMTVHPRSIQRVLSGCVFISV